MIYLALGVLYVLLWRLIDAKPEHIIHVSKNSLQVKLDYEKEKLLLEKDPQVQFYKNLGFVFDPANPLIMRHPDAEN